MRARVKKHARIADRPVDSHWLCAACDGLCCRSFVAVELSFAEYERLERLGARRLEFSLRGPHWLVIEGGCEFLAEGRCSIYEDRPDVCRRFACEDVAGCEAPPAHAPAP